MNRGTSSVHCLLVLIVASTLWAAQPERTNTTKQDITTIFLELSNTFVGRSLARVGEASYEGMEFVEDPYASITPVRALTVLSLEQDHIVQILKATESATYTVAEMLPTDPFQEISLTSDDMTAFRNNARILDRDTMRCWLDGDFDGALERVAGIIRLADMLIETHDSVAVLTGSALRSMAKDRLEAMVNAANTRQYPVRFSRAAIVKVRDQVLPQPRFDPLRQIHLTTTGVQRHIRWMRETFKGEDGAALYAKYLANYGQTEENLRTQDAMIQSMPKDLDSIKAFFSDDPEIRKKALEDHWKSLTPEERADAYHKHLEMVKKMQWWPSDSVPRLYLEDAAQPLTVEQISRQLDHIDTLLDQIARAQTRDEVRDSLLRLKTEIGRDRSQLTRIGAGVEGGAGLMSWKKSIETYDASLVAVDQLEMFIKLPGAG